MHVKPAPGVKVRDPITRRHLPVTGADVPESTYWVRRLQAGDVELVQAAPAAELVEKAAVKPGKGKE